VHDRAGRRVLQVHFFVRPQVFAHAECSKRRFVEPAEDEFLLAWIGIDVADRKDPRHVGCELRRIDSDLVLFKIEPPVRDWTQFRMQSPLYRGYVGDLAHLLISIKPGAVGLYSICIKPALWRRLCPWPRPQSATLLMLSATSVTSR